VKSSVESVRTSKTIQTNTRLAPAARIQWRKQHACSGLPDWSLSPRHRTTPLPARSRCGS